MAALVGLWDDHLVGENTKLDLRADGSAHVISLGTYRAGWTWDADSRRVTMARGHQDDDPASTWHLTYLPREDVLEARSSLSNGREHVQTFRRASPEAVAAWADLRPRLEADEAARNGR